MTIIENVIENKILDFVNKTSNYLLKTQRNPENESKDNSSINNILLTHYNNLFYEVLVYYDGALTEEQQKYYCTILYKLIYYFNNYLNDETCLTNTFFYSNKNELIFKLIYALGNVRTPIYDTAISSTLYFYEPFLTEMAKIAFSTIITINNQTHPQYTWLHISQFCDFLKIYGKCNSNRISNSHELYYYVINVIASELKQDFELLAKDYTNLSHIAYWVPREKNKNYGYIAKDIAYSVNPHFYNKSNHNTRAHAKIMSYYRQTIAELSVHINNSICKHIPNNWNLYINNNAKEQFTTNIVSIISLAELEQELYNHINDYTLFDIDNPESDISIEYIWEKTLYGDLPPLISEEDANEVVTELPPNANDKVPKEQVQEASTDEEFYEQLINFEKTNNSSSEVEFLAFSFLIALLCYFMATLYNIPPIHIEYSPL